MDARGTCDGRHRARKSCPDPECYLRAEPPELPPITDADNLAGELPWRPDEHGGMGQPSEEQSRRRAWRYARRGCARTDEHGGMGQPSEEHADPRHEIGALNDLPVTPDRDAPPRPVRDVRELEHDDRNQAHRDSLEAQATMDRLAAEPIEFGPGIYRWVCSRPGGYQRTVVAHDLPPAPEGWRWSSALAAAVGGRGALQVSAAVVDASEGAGAATGPQALQLEITGRTGYCTSLDVLLFARPA